MEINPAPVFWLTGLSGAGKSTLASTVSTLLTQEGFKSITIDGDVLRSGLNSDLGFTDADRAESVRRAAQVAALCSRAGVIVFVSLISPFIEGRARAREIIGNEYFREIYVNASLQTCRNRDIKGYYALADAGKIANFTGLTSAYEAPVSPDLMIDTTNEELAKCILRFHSFALTRCR
ncbi:adenylyl-sulfate kinase [Caballeronia novacaledonica]|uniref:Adenylyl-sulfate kinase n=1 Tax=Caballeronia novacaledonica TaxID=1544861 RepID=A0ACB5QZD6_9BURK|nr:adenylyl-sulfate kinase [Caballeronia novacaledonica]